MGGLNLCTVFALSNALSAKALAKFFSLKKQLN